WMIVFALMTLAMFPSAVMPAFGVFLTGPLALAFLGTAVVLQCTAAFACYRQWMIGWFIALALLVIFPVSWFTTIYRRGMLAYYVAAGYPADQLEQMQRYPFMSNPNLALVGLVPVTLGLGFLLYVRRHFGKTAPVAVI